MPHSYNPITLAIAILILSAKWMDSLNSSSDLFLRIESFLWFKMLRGNLDRSLLLVVVDRCRSRIFGTLPIANSFVSFSIAINRSVIFVLIRIGCFFFFPSNLIEMWKGLRIQEDRHWNGRFTWATLALIRSRATALHQVLSVSFLNSADRLISIPLVNWSLIIDCNTDN